MTKTKSLAIALSICCANALYAESIQLQEVTLSETAEVGSNKSVNMEQVEKTQSKDLKDVFRGESSVSVSNGASSDTQRIYLRGIESSNLNVTLDGASVGANLFQHRSNMTGVDADLLKKVDIQTTSSAENGKGALGGSISMTTKDAQDLVEGDKTTGAIIRMSHSSAEDLNKGSTTVYGVFDKYYGIYANVSAQNGGNYTTGDSTEVLATGKKDRDYFIKFSMIDKDNHTVRVGVGRHTSEGKAGDDKGAPTTLTAEEARSDRRLTRDTVTLEHIYNPENSLINIATNVYKNDTKEVLTSSSGTQSGQQQEVIGGKIKNTFTTDIGVTHNIFVFGMDYSEEEGSRQGEVTTTNGRSKVNVISDNLGVFSQNTTNIDKFAINYGARVDKYESTFGPQTISGTETSPNVGIEYQATETIGLFANYGEAVRATGIIPIGWMTYIDEDDWVNNSIKPETSTQKEVGIKYKVKNIFTDNDRLNVTLTRFDTTIKNMIETTGGGSAKTYIQNSTAPVETKGYEVKASWENNLWYTSVSYTDAKTTNDGVETNATRRKGASSGDKLVWYTDYQITPDLSFGYRMTAVKGLEYSTTTKPGYVVHDINAEWESPYLKGFSLSLAINNLTNLVYTDHTTVSTSGTNQAFTEPGRDYRVSMKYKF
ncbi:MAG: TonB-dependent receptor [Arcobacteraceae bacterium]|jgi:hemoglobin/transferrin/lactoferrin receptor protein|nr:TonB-dependent receptor [Arcobacteraceae bacterium]